MHISENLKIAAANQDARVVSADSEYIRATNVRDHVRRMLVELGFSLSEMSSLSTAQNGAKPASLVPRSFLSTLRKGVSPHIGQVAALSNLTNSLLIDWLSLFGFDLGAITRLQVRLHSVTTLIMPKERLLPPGIQPPPALTPNNASPHPPPERPLLFAKIGLNDGMAFPEIMPGSVVSVDTKRTAIPLSGRPRTLYLVEHLRGLSCCYVNRVNEQEILLTPHYLPYPCLRYRIGEQAIILGTIESELRPLRDISVPDPARSSLIERPSPLRTSRAQSLSQFLRTSRERIGLRFREAKSMTEAIALEMGSQEYAIGLGSLSDYEASDTLPRHISKIISLCIAYGIDFMDYMAAAGLSLCEDRKTALPRSDSLATRSPAGFGAPNDPSLRFWSESWYRLPVSVLQAFADSLPNRSSLQWMESSSVSSDPHLPRVPGILLVDTSCTRFERATWPAMWQRPIYLVQHRSGRLIYGFCTITDGLLIVHEDPGAASRVESFSRYEVDVIGRVVAVLRAVNVS